MGLITAEVINQSEAKSLHYKDYDLSQLLRPINTCVKVAKNTPKVDYDQQTGTLLATFDKMKLGNLERSKGLNDAADEKFVLFFSIRLKMRHNFVVTICVS